MKNNDGMIIEIDKKFKDGKFIYCCDVSWISKFPNECEILFARSLQTVAQSFRCRIKDESRGVQTVMMDRAERGWKWRRT